MPGAPRGFWARPGKGVGEGGPAPRRPTIGPMFASLGSPHLRGIALLLVVTALWGSTFAVVKVLGQELPPAALIAWRFTIGAAVLGAFAAWPRARERGPLEPGERPRPSSAGLYSAGLRSAGLWRDGLTLGLWLIAGYATQTIALQTTSANRAAFITALSVILVPLWLTFAQGRRLPLTLWLALPLAVGGLALLSWEGGALVVGDLWALACALTYAGFIVALEGRASRQAALPFAFAQVAVVAGCAWVWVLLSGAPLLPPPGAWGPLLYLGILATALTTLLQTLGQRHVSAAEASLIYALEPVTASLFSFVLIHERIGWGGALGGALVVLATLLSTREEGEAKERPAPVGGG